ncbi:hypothetical protein B484DRAFT_471169 [Ochromonadaceae sp. CCMP2298]|nr:hypothetical protein B484DRAFT_471169 [Ochromonadaceae sp. CCMP2298]
MVASINLCPNVPGQVSVGLMVNPPRLGEPSYALYRSEKEQVIDSLKRRARMMTDAFNSMEGVSCQETEGAMYAFPQITLPPAFVVEAGRLGKAPDVLYCLELLAASSKLPEPSTSAPPSCPPRRSSSASRTCSSPSTRDS